MNKIIIELCAEDRERIDKLTESLKALQPIELKVEPLEGVIAGVEPFGMWSPQEVETPEPEKTPEAPAEAPQAPAETEPTPEPVKTEPSVDLAQIQQKVVQLCASGEKKAAVRAVINEYGAKVSDLKDQPEKWDEVWAKLCKIETEG